jgi:hypothetical protein
VTARQGVIKEVLESGEARAWNDFTDGMVPARATSAALQVDGAEKCIPAPRRHSD